MVATSYSVSGGEENYCTLSWYGIIWDEVDGRLVWV